MLHDDDEFLASSRLQLLIHDIRALDCGIPNLFYTLVVHGLPSLGIVLSDLLGSQCS